MSEIIFMNPNPESRGPKNLKRGQLVTLAETGEKVLIFTAGDQVSVIRNRGSDETQEYDWDDIAAPGDEFIDIGEGEEPNV
jgi:hypothetical protein